jgi:hypothetical protein
MFRHSDARRKSGGVPNIFRLFLSLIIMGILGIGLFQAYRSFSGVDPLELSPKSLANNLLSSQKVYDLVTGLLTVNPSVSLDRAKGILKDPNTIPTGTGADSDNTKTPTAPLAFKFAIITDSHSDNDSLRKALTQAKRADSKFVIGLGDWTNVGTLDELKAAKNEFDKAGLPYYLTAGDHDLWDARDKKLTAQQNFMDVFGPPYQSFSYQNLRAIIIFDADNYLGLDGVQLQWIESELAKAQEEGKLTLIFTSTPFAHPSSDHVLGRVNEKLKNQAEHLTSISKKSGVAEIFAGDTHMYSRYTEPTNNLKMTTVGAVTSLRNPQAPRFVIVDIYQDGSYTVEDTEIK